MIKASTLLLAFTFVAPTLLAATLASAEPKEEGRRRGPPPQAFDACKAKKADDACEVSFRERKLTGKCTATPEGPLVCRPDRPMGPPPELLAACESKKEGDACKATLPDRAVDGQCQKSRQGDKLICRPAKSDR
jgi:hypothetical protein